MKKILVIYTIFIIILFFVPVLFVRKSEKINNEFNESERKIRLLFSGKNEIVELSLDEYIMGVLIGEMPVSYELEALKAQAIVARTYTLNKIINSPNSHENADMCDDINHCQAYKTKEYALACWDDEEENDKWNKIKKAVLETQNEVITYNGQLINAFFHANSGGKTEDSLNIWGKENIPYLKSVDGFEEDIFADSVEISYKDFENIMKKNYSNYISRFDETVNKTEDAKRYIEELPNIEQKETVAENVNEFIKILEKNSSGRVSKIQVSNIVMEGTVFRSLFGLRSTFIEINIGKNYIVFNTKGYGHGIGLSQDGANALAKKGLNYQEIIKHYYTSVNIEKYN